MKSKLLLSAALVACAVAVAPLAVAQQQGQSAPRAGAMAPVTAHGHSVSFLIHHAYQEALHAHESVASGMNEMAQNHLENVVLTLAPINANQASAMPGLGTKLTQIRTEAQAAQRNPSAAGTTALVNRFVSLVAAMPAPATGGGGGMGATPEVMMPADLLALAAVSAANTQLDAAHRDFMGAGLHARHVVAVLDAAIQSARRNRVANAQIQPLQTLLSQARQVESLVSQRSAQAVGASGMLVTRIGGALPQVIAAQGGGAGTGNQQQKPNQKK